MAKPVNHLIFKAQKSALKKYHIQETANLLTDADSKVIFIFPLFTNQLGACSQLVPLVM